MTEPLPLAMILCDTVYRDPATGKATILGIFGSIVAYDFPLIVDQIAVFATLTNARGKVHVEVTLTPMK